jgi:NAD(P)H-dependent nitrite reductase small subunit
MPGGEVTPDGLIAVGQVAKKYGLYTKITGGARVDMFGARVEQLPSIWEELIAAGFESGHAYGKSLRTVKSCVGSTWCRYGVDDSVGLAVELENRYKGLRAPHKIKFGVSGCTRECAEAQGKDVGIIATEKGWNLYVCGNGGMKPRHAELFASDLTKAQLIQLIDRFLMFYVRTADRLQRTSTWRENLEGGLDYLKGVLLQDSLGIAGELEAQMQHVVDTYQCEWKTAVNDPVTRQRFRSFVNSEKPDEHIVFVKERGQIRPAARRSARRSPPPRGCRSRLNPRGFHMTTDDHTNWTAVCAATDILPDTGVCALVEGVHVAIFSVGREQALFAIDNVDPKAQASVLSRGLVGSLGERIVVASPLYKNHFDLRSGECLEAPEHSVRAHAVRVHEGRVLVALGCERRPFAPFHFFALQGIQMAYLAPAEFVTKMVDAGESKLLMSTRDTLIRSYMAGAILALAAAFAGQHHRQHRQRAGRRDALSGRLHHAVPAGLRPADGRVHARAARRARQAPRRHLGRRAAQLGPGVHRQLRGRAHGGGVHGDHLHLRLQRGAQRHRREARPHRRRPHGGLRRARRRRHADAVHPRRDVQLDGLHRRGRGHDVDHRFGQGHRHVDARDGVLLHGLRTLDRQHVPVPHRADAGRQVHAHGLPDLERDPHRARQPGRRPDLRGPDAVLDALQDGAQACAELSFAKRSCRRRCA